jgi:hypoxanthine phosphoribosyltransferase
MPLVGDRAPAVQTVGIRSLISAGEIAARVAALAAEIVRAIPGDFVVVGLLNGAAVFVADLVRALDRAGARPEIEFMRLSSYGLATESSGTVRLLDGVGVALAGRRVLLVDDIVDSGRSIAFAARLLRRRGIGELWTCALIDKPGRRQVEVRVDFVGFPVGDVFVGYGADYAEKFVAAREFLQSSALRAPSGGLFLLWRCEGRGGGPSAVLGAWRGSCLPPSGCG